MKKINTGKKIALLVIIMFISILSVNAQDARFTQFYANPLRLNPAIMGPSTDMKFILGYRSQWAVVDKGYQTSSFTAMYPVFLNENKNKLDIGFNVMNDKAGAFSNLDFMLAVNSSIQIAQNSHISFSLTGGYVQNSLNTSGLTYDNQYVLGSYSAANPSNELTISQSVSHADVGFGLMWYMNPTRTESKLNAFAGVSGFHLNQPSESFTGSGGVLPRKLSFQGGFKILGDNKVDIAPNVRVNTQNGNVETAVGLYVDYNFNDDTKLVIGSWYRRNDAVAFLLGCEYKSFIFGYSYDVITSDINKAITGVGAHELTLSFKLSRLKDAAPSVRPSIFSSF